jgi:hypothetical protein
MFKCKNISFMELKHRHDTVQLNELVWVNREASTDSLPYFIVNISHKVQHWTLK